MSPYLISALTALMFCFAGTGCAGGPAPSGPCGTIAETPFKATQKKNARVKQAYIDKEASIIKLLNTKNICPGTLRLFIRAFKLDKKLEIWAKNDKDTTFQLIKTYKICVLSGKEGPKRKEGDGQVPEGFYHINNFNHNSRFHLSMGLNYPNASDEILSDPQNPGYDIFIHGDCVSIGCMPITDDMIKELYVLCVEAVNAGQKDIPVHIFPTRLTLTNLTPLYKKHSANKALLDFWQNLKPGYDYFEKYKKLPIIDVNPSGQYVVIP